MSILPIVPLAITGTPATSGDDTWTFRPLVSGGSGNRSFQFGGAVLAGGSRSSTTGEIRGPWTALGTMQGLSVTVTDQDTGEQATYYLPAITITLPVVARTTVQIAGAKTQVFFDNRDTSTMYADVAMTLPVTEGTEVKAQIAKTPANPTGAKVTGAVFRSLAVNTRDGANDPLAGPIWSATALDVKGAGP